ncbi:MAG: FkbM family methyltransferase, partial [Rickettsiella sp.]|nr:FkbM family methyltransferase [Rickettsiella sp.]
PLIACVPNDAIGQEIVMYGLYEEKLLHYLFEKIFSNNDLHQFKRKQVIDGGANIGNHSLFFSRYFKNVIAFEPNPVALKLLDTNIFLNKTENIQVIPFGLSNESNVLPFLEDSENLGGSGFNFPKESLPTHQLRVEKGDILLKNMQTTPIALIKLDIEGHELNALQGLEQTINTHQPIILFEAGTSKGKNGSKAVFNYLSQHNYKYFYTVEEKKPHPFFLLRFLEKFKGYEIVLEQINEPENRYYSLIIATTTPLSVTNS